MSCGKTELILLKCFAQCVLSVNILFYEFLFRTRPSVPDWAGSSEDVTSVVPSVELGNSGVSREGSDTRSVAGEAPTPFCAGQMVKAVGSNVKILKTGHKGPEKDVCGKV